GRGGGGWGRGGGVEGGVGADDPVGSLLGGSACRDRGLEQVGRRWLLGQLVGVITRDLVLQLQARAAGGRQLRQRCPQALDPGRIELERRQVGLGEVPVVVRVFLGALGKRPLLGLGPA